MEKRRAAKKKVGRPSTGRRPVLAVRVHEPLYEKIKAAATKLGLSISEETERRLVRSFEWEAAFGDVEKWQAEADEVIRGGIEASLRHLGYHKVRDREGPIWVGPGVSEEKYIALNPQLETVIERVVMRTLQKAKEQ